MVNRFENLHLQPAVVDLVRQADKRIKKQLEQADTLAEINSAKVLSAFHKNQVSEAHFTSTTGYGYDDMGRETLERIYADIFCTEDALVRHSIVSGTHALALCLYGILRPGDTLLGATGKPYDTLEEVIGISGGEGGGSLKDFGILYRQVDLKTDGTPDLNGIVQSLDNTVKVVWIQKSKGYDWRNSLSSERIGEIVRLVKQKKPDCICVVDNCYGEFVEEREPTEHGADLAAGSLIKNPGGGIAPSGAYIVGRADLVELAACRLTAPGIGKHVGATLGHNKEMFQGIFMAPFTTCQNIKTAILCAAVFEELGFAVHPASDAARYCTIQAIRFAEEKKLVSFCQGIQKGAPVDAFVTPQPWDMPGYQHQVIMAAGTFVQGATSELSADAPIKEPYIAYMQGGLAYSYSKLGLMCAVQHMLDEKTISL